MNEKEKFGELFGADLEVGDIVEWTTWSGEKDDWNYNYGVLLEMNNQLRSNHIVSISRVMPLNEPHMEMEFFTMSLRRVSEQKVS
jgi:hypothetical protein